MNYSCVIPNYNEKNRIVDVLTQAIRIKKIGEIICVDDGSTDNSSQMIKKNFPQVTLIKHEKNLGKTAAVLTGVNYSKGDNLLLLDADLKYLNSTEIEHAITLFESNNLDCLLFNTSPMSMIDQFQRLILRFLLLSAGNRIIRKDSLKSVLSLDDFGNYQLEIAQNKYLMEHNKKIAYFDISAVNVSKISKNGFVKGTIGEIRMWREIIAYTGLLFFLKQTFLFEMNKVK